MVKAWVRLYWDSFFGTLREIDMEAVLQTRGLLSLPPKPTNATSLLNPSQGLNHRLFASKPLGFNGLCLFYRRVPSVVAKPNGVPLICKAKAASAAKGSSADIIPFLKTWVNLPMAVGFMLLYTKLANVLSKKALFYTVIVPFIAFFGAFGFLLYPLSNYIHPQALSDKLLAVLGPRFLGPLAIMRIWSFCLFYVMAELWGSVVISVLFWGFANQITTVEEAKRFYRYSD
ncbi:hypothetical protein J1N35_033204 [Gossypium stocksii]|uniref:ADP,ATP carrier protein n=1 Tax=Gossypium stocksii TaxID=47602 RepID=A0A9D3UQH7_9ROSI|nr:hypothetical protein J1N35_033204 [Gossypium stocksii]